MKNVIVLFLSMHPPGVRSSRGDDTTGRVSFGRTGGELCSSGVLATTAFQNTWVHVL